MLNTDPLVNIYLERDLATAYTLGLFFMSIATSYILALSTYIYISFVTTFLLVHDALSFILWFGLYWHKLK